MIRVFPAVAKVFSIQMPRRGLDMALGGLIVSGIITAIYTVMWWLDIPTSFQFVWRNVPVDVSMLTLIIIVLFWIDGYVYIKKHQEGLTHQHYAIAGTIVAIVVVASVAFHELCHGIMAAAFGNNIDHAGISWWGAFVAPSASLSQMSPFEQILIAGAGPFANVVIGFFAMIYVKTHGESLTENTVQYIGMTNFRLARLNMLPLFLLDGGKVADGFLRYIITDSMWRGIALVAIWGVFFYHYRKYRKTRPTIEDRLASM